MAPLFFGFIGQMLPLAAAMMLTLLALCWFCFPASGSVTRAATGRRHGTEARLELSGTVCGVSDGAGDESGPRAGAGAAGLPVLARAVIVHVDWSLLLVFMVMFIDVHLLTQLPALHQVLSGVGTLSGGELWLTAIGLSAGDWQRALDYSAAQRRPAVDTARLGG